MAQDFKLSSMLYEEAYTRGMTFSAFLETLDPTSKHGESERGRDAFARQLERLDIRTRSLPMSGIHAHPVSRFYEADDMGEAEERATLFPEFISRVYRAHSAVMPRFNWGLMPDMAAQRQVTTHNPLSDVLWPDALDGAMRWQQLEPSLLSFIVGRTRSINSDTFKAFYLDDSTVEADARMKRVGEYAAVPAMTIAGSDNTITVKKYGRALEASYEILRRVGIDLLGWWIAYIAAKADNDKYETAVDVLINGDGNSGTAATETEGSTLDAAAAGVLTLRMWLRYGMLWTRPHRSDVVVGLDESIADLLLLNAGSANLPPEQIVTAGGALGQVTLARPIYGGMVAINNTQPATDKLLSFDSRFTLEMVTEAGSDIVETNRIIRRQFDEVVITESVGFDIMTLGQNRLLDFAN